MPRGRKKLPVHQAEAAITLALEHAARSAEQGETKVSIANRVYDMETVYVAMIRRPWIIGLMVRILDRLERNRPTGTSQLPLPIPGLILPPVLSTGKGARHKVPPLDATRPQLAAARKKLVAENQGKIQRIAEDPKIRQLDQMIAFMDKHAPRKRTVTFREIAEQYHFEFVVETAAKVASV